MFEDYKTLYETALSDWRADHVAMDRERRFALDLEHYSDDQSNAPDSSRVLPKTEALTRVIRFKKGEILQAPLYYEVRPTDPEPDELSNLDADFSDFGKWLIGLEIENPVKRFYQRADLAVLSGLANRLGIMTIDFHPECGTYGSILCRIVQPENLMWDTTYGDLHDPRTSWCMEVSRMKVKDAKAKRGWKDKDKYQADPGPGVTRTSNSSGTLTVNDVGYGQGIGNDDGLMTVVKLWKRYDSSKRRTENAAKFDALPEGSRFMLCGAEDETGQISGGCGYQSPREDQSPEGKYPPVSPASCPTCGGDLTRVDSQVPVDEYVAYPNGKLVLFMPYCGAVAYDDAQPFKLRSYPYFAWQSNAVPHKVIGPSETTYKWTLQLMDDASFRMGYEQMARNRDITLMPAIGLEDSNGNPFDWMSGDPFAYYNGAESIGPNSIFHYQGSGLNPAWGQFRNSVRSAFREDEGSADMSPGLGGPKDIPVGTIETYAEKGSVPVEQQRRSFELEMGLFLGTWLDMAVATYTEQQVYALRGMDGVIALRGLRERMANVQILARPSLAKVTQDSLIALGQWYQMPPALRKIAARRMNIPASDVREVEAAEAQMMQQQAALAAQGMVPGGPEPQSQNNQGVAQ